jgi:Phospholipase_D-nuclease N-terminal
MYMGLGGLLVLILDIYVIMSIIGSGLDPGMKLVWVIVVLLLPLLGAILYLLLGGGKRIT